MPDDSVVVDAVGLLQAWQRGDVDTVVRLYRGQLLEGFTTHLGGTFENWLDAKTAEFSAAVVGSHGKAIATAASGGDWHAVLRLVDAVWDIHPDRAALRRRRLHALAAQGMTRKAASATLADKGSLSRPKKASAASLAAIGATEFDHSGAEELRTPVVGRRHEFRTLCGLLERLDQTGLRFATIEGEPGIGKSRLGLHFLRFAALRGARVLIAVGQPYLRHVAHSSVAELLRSSIRPGDLRLIPQRWHSALNYYLPDMVIAESELPTSHVTHFLRQGVSAIIEALALRSPVIVFVDDVEWADDAALAQLDHLLRHLTAERVLVVLTLTPGLSTGDNVQPLLAAATGHGRLTKIVLGQLDPQSASELVDCFENVSRHTIDEPTRRAVLAAVGGRPFFLLELLKSAVAGSGQGTVRGHGLPFVVPAALSEAINSRFERLELSSRMILRALAISGYPLPHRVLMRTCALDHNDYAQAVHTLTSNGLVAESEGVLSAAADVIRDVVMAGMSRRELASMHSCLALILEQEGTLFDEAIAHHYKQGGDDGSASARFVAAAEAAITAESYRDAERNARAALGLARDDSLRRRARWVLFRVLWATRRLADAKAVATEEAFEGGAQKPSLSVKPMEHTQVVELLADLLEGEGDVARCLGDALEFADTETARADPIAYAELLRTIAGVANGLRDGGFWRAFLPKLKRRGLELAHDEAAAIVLSACACVEAIHHSSRDAYDTAQCAIRRAEASAAKLALVRSQAALGTVCLLAGRLDEAETFLDRARTLASSAGLLGPAMAASNNFGLVLLEKGRWSEAIGLFSGDLPRATRYDRLVRQCNLAIAYREVGNAESALAEAHAVLREANRFDARWATTLARSIIGSYAYVRRDRLAGRREYHAVAAILDDVVTDSADQSYAQCFVAVAQAEDGDPGGAMERLERATARSNDRHVLASIRMRVVSARLVGLSDRTRALRLLDDIREWALACNANGVLARVERGTAAIVSGTKVPSVGVF